MDQNFFDSDIHQKFNEIRREALLGIRAGESGAAIVSKIFSRLDAVGLFCLLQDPKWDLDADIFDDLKSESSVAKKNFSRIFARVAQKLVAFCEKARREGLLALEDELEDLDEEFIRRSRYGLIPHSSAAAADSMV